MAEKETKTCQNCKNQFTIEPEDFEFYARIKVPKGTYQNTAKHFHDNNHCPNEFETSYAPDRSEIVYCEQCYNGEVA